MDKSVEQLRREDWALDETIEITGMGDSTLSGTFMGTVKLRVKGVWKNEISERVEQLKAGAIVELKMHKMIGKGRVVSRENIDIDFNEESSDVLQGTTADRAGGRVWNWED